MTSHEYRSHPASYFIGRQVRALRELNNSYQSVAAGTVLTVRNKRGGFDLKGPRCEQCGVSIYIRKVDPSSVELI